MQKSSRNFPKNPEKIFKKNGNPRGRAVLPIYIVDVMVKADNEDKGPLTVAMIQKFIKEDYGIFYYHQDIEFHLTNWYCYCKHLVLLHTPVDVPGSLFRSTAAAFSIQFKNSNNNTNV